MWDLIVSVPDHCLSFYFELIWDFMPFLNFWSFMTVQSKMNEISPERQFCDGHYTHHDGHYNALLDALKTHDREIKHIPVGIKRSNSRYGIFVHLHEFQFKRAVPLALYLCCFYFSAVLLYVSLSRLVFRAGCGIRLYWFLIIAFYLLSIQKQ